MLIYREQNGGHYSVREQPWSTSLADETWRYYDFRKHPHLIRTVLEDFKGWETFGSVQEFYALLEYLNGPDSSFETNDCVFRGPKTNPSERFKKALQCSGRLMVFFSDVALNTSTEHTDWLLGTVEDYVSQIDPTFAWGCVALETAPTQYVTIRGTEKDQLGPELVVSFWAWGDDESETMQNFGRLVGGLSQVFHLMQEDIQTATDAVTPQTLV